MANLVMLIGVPGSGKSTISNEYKEKGYKIHSSDAIRKEILGDENSQEKGWLIFKILHKRVISDLLTGKNVVYDACNTTKSGRKKVIKEIREAVQDVYIIGKILNVDINICKERNRNRERVVPDEVIDRMYNQLKSNEPNTEEGFNEIQKV